MKILFKMMIVLYVTFLFSCQTENEEIIENIDIPGVIVNEDGTIVCQSLSSALQLEPKYRKKVWLIVFNFSSNTDDMDKISDIIKFENIRRFSVASNHYLSHDTLNFVLDLIYKLDLKKLREIELLGTVRDSLPNNIYKFKNLESLIIGYDISYPNSINFNEEFADIRYVDERILKLSNLRELRTQLYFKDSIPDFIFGLKQLETFSYMSDSISPKNIERISEFKELKYLFLYDVNLSNISFQNWKFSDLKEFELVNNNIEGKIDFIKYSPNLQVLHIQKYKISNVDEFLAYLKNNTNLKKLSLWNCNITMIPESIKNLSSLEMIVLFDNPIEYIDPNLLLLKNLKYCYLPSGSEELAEPFIKKMSWCRFQFGLQ